MAQYRVEDSQIVILSPDGTTTGRIVNPATVGFPRHERRREAFGGAWVPSPGRAVVDLGDARHGPRHAALGWWRIRGETDVLDFQADGTYTWGRLSGSFQMLDAQRVRMTMDQDGNRIGQLDNGFVVDGDELRLTAPDGAMTTHPNACDEELCEAVTLTLLQKTYTKLTTGKAKKSPAPIGNASPTSADKWSPRNRTPPVSTPSPPCQT